MLHPKTKLYFKQECIPVGCVPAARRPYAGVCFRGGVGSPSRGGWVLHPGGWVLHPGGGGFSNQGGSSIQGGSPSGGGMASQHALRQTPPPCGQTHTCKNITLATTSLRPVKKGRRKTAESEKPSKTIIAEHHIDPN